MDQREIDAIARTYVPPPNMTHRDGGTSRIEAEVRTLSIKGRSAAQIAAAVNIPPEAVRAIIAARPHTCRLVKSAEPVRIHRGS